MLTALENLTLTEAELEACRPIRQGDGQRLRAFCPFHGSDHQRSLAVKLESGRFECYACGAWGYVAEKRRVAAVGERRPVGRMTGVPAPRRPAVSTLVHRDDLVATLRAFQSSLAGSWGARYLESRRISVSVAARHGVGYSGPGEWLHRQRDWRGGRVVFPHHTPDGRLVNLYGRAVGSEAKGLQKQDRHDHLSGPKGWFNAVAVERGEGPLYVCEGGFDALALMEAGFSRVVAIFGLAGWRWDWIPSSVGDVAFCLDDDPPAADGTPARSAVVRRQLAQETVMRGKRAWMLPREALGGEKDVAAAWSAGVLQVDMLRVAPVEEFRREGAVSGGGSEVMPAWIPTESAVQHDPDRFRCYACQRQTWYRTASTGWVCGVCHPPVDAEKCIWGSWA